MSSLGRLIEGEIRRQEHEAAANKEAKYGDYKVTVASDPDYEKRFEINSWKADIASAIIAAIEDLQATTGIIPSDFDVTKESLHITISPTEIKEGAV